MLQRSVSDGHGHYRGDRAGADRPAHHRARGPRERDLPGHGQDSGDPRPHSGFQPRPQIQRRLPGVCDEPILLPRFGLPDAHHASQVRVPPSRHDGFDHVPAGRRSTSSGFIPTSSTLAITRTPQTFTPRRSSRRRTERRRRAWWMTGTGNSCRALRRRAT